MASFGHFVCVHCGRHDFIDESALSRHISQNELCRQIAANLGSGQQPDYGSAESLFAPDSPEFMPFEPESPPPPPPQNRVIREPEFVCTDHYLDAIQLGMQDLMNSEFQPTEPEFQDEDDDSRDSDYYEQLAAELDQRRAEEATYGTNSGQND